MSGSTVRARAAIGVRTARAGFDARWPLLGIDPRGVVHIADRLLREVDGPMLRTGLQGFHSEAIAVPRRPEDRPDPKRLESRFELFVRRAA